MTQETLVSISVIILLLPLFGFITTIFFGRRMPRQGDLWETGILFTALLLSLVVLFVKLIAFPQDTIEFSFHWIDFGDAPFIGPLKVDLGVVIDNLSAIMLAVVCIVSAFVHLFSIGYMRGDVRYSRYFSFLGLFTFSMLAIVLTNNFFAMYVGWELVGLCSYLLIGHWYEKQSASDAAKKAFIVNRIGDIGMFSGIMILYHTFRTFGFTETFHSIAEGRIPFGSEAWLTAAGILIFCGAVGKSAQFPLHVWLPDAMEGPTPVSALIHAATMVAAGVYLVARTFPMMTADALLVIAYVGAVTAFVSATIAIAQNDIKRVLAYSTISQLGYMVMGLGVGAYTAGFFHLTTHAMFKAGLFLGSGSVIYAMHASLHHVGGAHIDPQDIRNMGGLRARMPITFWTFLIYALAISGIPLTSGFLSKDEILAGTLAFGEMTGHYLIPIVGFFVTGLTAFYMFRVVILTFMGEHKDPLRIEHIHESPAVMTIPLIVFAVLSFFAFYSFNPVGPSDGWFFHVMERPESVVPLSVRSASIQTFEEALHQSHVPAMGLSLAVAGLGILAAFTTYYWRKINADAMATRFKGLYEFLLNKWYFDELYGAVVVGGALMLTRMLRWFDDTIVDGIVNGAARWTYGASFGFKELRKERNLSGALFLVAGAAVSIWTGWYAGTFLRPHEPSLGAYALSVIGGVAVGLLSFFTVWAGTGGFDKYIVDGAVNGIAYLSGFFGLVLRKFQTGKVQSYLVFVILGAIAFFLFFRSF